ncbi:unnamed protein product, partial [Owenia fusiformis]
SLKKGNANNTSYSVKKNDVHNILHNMKRNPMDNRKGMELISRLLQNWPRDKPKAFIYFLLQDEESRMVKFWRALSSFDKFFNLKYNYPIIIFHERNFRETIKSKIQSKTNSPIIFQQIEFVIPNFIIRSKLEAKVCGAGIGYRHMCRFHAKLLAEHQLMQNFDYYLRLDDDSLILKPISYDIFRHLRDNKYTYGYLLTTMESPICAGGLWEGTQRFIQKKNITPQFYPTWPKYKIFYNNFEVSSTSIWRTDAYASYIDYIDRMGAIFYARWGDAPIKTLGLSLFVSWRQIIEMPNISYRHQNMQTRW